jgi:hypothetical protein
MQLYAIHAETRLVSNIRGEPAPWVGQYHLVVLGGDIDEMGRKRSVCNRAVDPQPSKPLRDWFTLTGEERCRACDEEAGDNARRLIELQASSIWEQP